jgi:hypothetical protein
MHRYEGNIKMYLQKKQAKRVGNGFTRLRIGTSGEVLQIW